MPKKTHADNEHWKRTHDLMEFYNNLKENGIREDRKYKSSIDFKAFLIDNNITQEKISKERGISLFSVRSLVRGNNINYNTALKVSEYLKIKFSTLFHSENENTTLSEKTIHHYHAFISSILSTAVI